MTQDNAGRDRFWHRIILILSVVVVAAVAFLILGPRPEHLQGSLDVSALPLVNATLNSTTTILLVVGFALIKAGRIPAHRAAMLAAFGASIAFLVTYVIYHWFKAGPAQYTGEWVTTYRVILLTHILLAPAVVPMALLSLYRGWTDQREKHRKLARITLPIWLYVSITGVLIYVMLYL